MSDRDGEHTSHHITQTFHTFLCRGRASSQQQQQPGPTLTAIIFLCKNSLGPRAARTRTRRAPAAGANIFVWVVNMFDWNHSVWNCQFFSEVGGDESKSGSMLTLWCLIMWSDRKMWICSDTLIDLEFEMKCFHNCVYGNQCFAWMIFNTRKCLFF